jgi:hypothetical protein
MASPYWPSHLRYRRSKHMMNSLCESCQHIREVRTARSRFLLCELLVTRADFPKYPRQPVERCAGYQEKSVSRPDGANGEEPGGPA